MSRDKPSKRQQTMKTLFPQRMREGAQLALGFGAGGHQHVLRCAFCQGLMHGRTCAACRTFVCTGCQSWTTGNGGNGVSCYACMFEVNHV